MTVNKVAGLFEALAQTPNIRKVKQPTDEAVAQTSSQNSSAVSFAPGLGNDVGEADRAAREERVAQLKEQVANKTYEPDTNAVAQAIARELFV